jgi:cytochrome c oxidase subunit 2
MSSSGSTAAGSGGTAQAPSSGPPGPGSPGLDRGALVLVALGVGLDLLASRWLMAQVPHWLPPQASTAAPMVDDLFRLEVGIGCFLLLGCTAVMVWTLLFDRTGKYDRDDGEPIEGNLPLEITWTVIPLVLVLLIAWQAIRVNGQLASLGGKVRVAGAAEALRLVGIEEQAGGSGAASLPATKRRSAPPLTTAPLSSHRPGVPAAELGPVVVIARQWSWEFVYPNGVRSGELHLPLNRPVRLRLLSLDVLHGLSIPAFRLRQDVVPGSVIDYRLTPSREGRYRLRDSLFSGAYFAANQTDVVVESDAAFASWLENALGSPLVPNPNPASELWQQRLRQGNRGWATVAPATPPLVNAPLDLNAPHAG